MGIKSWQIKLPSDKEKAAAKKKSVQDKFRQHLGLLIDTPKQGFGSTNDGNTARRFFENPKLTASITGIEIPIIEKFATILSVLSCGRAIKIDAFRDYCLETAKHYVSLYEWYYMPSSVHQILIHGADVIEHAIMPIGCLSEEPQECRNKDIKKFREDHTRKCSRLGFSSILLEQFNIFLISD